MFRPRTFAAIGVLAVAAAPAVALASSGTSTAHRWQNSKHDVVCGFRIHQTSTPQVLCSANDIPRPANQPHGDAGFVVISAHGKPQTIVTFQDEFVGGSLVTLKNGTKWSGRGVTCTANAKVTCKNKSGHGFTIGDVAYKHF